MTDGAGRPPGGAAHPSAVPMTPERWGQIEAVLDAALDLPAEERAAYVAGACDGDPALRAEVERLLAASEEPDLLPDVSAARFAAPLVARTLGGLGGGGSDVRDAHAGTHAGRRRRDAAPERIGPYRVVREAGQGGMGTVYVAERDDGQFRMRVAVKLVRRGLHLDEQFVRRFVEERRILARLEHPNVARLLDGGVTDEGLPYYVMEFVDGEPIDRWCDRRRLSVDARLDLFCKACQAVAYAHRNRVIHRDLKPSNILVTEAGEPKLVDFGIAKLLRDAARDAAHAHTDDAGVPSLTRTGQRLLTPEYASPEQVRGEAVTEASDVYALGVLLYELLTGRRPYGHTGRTAHDVERAILEEEPTRPSAAVRRPLTSGRGAGETAPPSMTRLSDLRDTTSDGLRQRLRGDLDAIVLTALRKEPDRRYASADDFASDVRRHLAGRPVLARGDGATYRLRKFVRRHRISATAAAIGMAAGIGVIVAAARSGAWGLGEARDAAGRIVPGATRRVAFGAALELDPAPSPDGRMLAYAADSGGVMRIYVRPLAGGPVAALTAAIPGYHRAPRWSPDGSRIAFQSEGSLYVVPAAGGTPQGLVSAPREGSWVAYPAWSPDGRQIAYVQDWAVYARPTAGGQPRLVTRVPNEPHSLAWSPDGRWIALVAGNWEFTFGIRPWGTTVNLGNIAPSEIWLVPAAGGAPVRVTEGRALNTSPVWLPDGRGLLFVSNRDGDRDVYHVRIGDDGRVASAPSRVTAGLGAHSVALSRDGTRLVYSVFRSAANLWALPLGDGQPVDETGARPVTRGSQMIEGVSVSRDGRWLAFDTDRNGNQDVYVVATDGGDQAWQAGEPTPLASDAADEFMPHWSPSGRELAYYRFGPDGRRRMMTIRFPEGDARPVTDRPADQRSPHWSPDGRSLVFSSDETGRHELYVVTRETDGRWGRARPLTADGGYAGRWSPDGRTISFVRQDGIWTIPSAGGAPRPVLRIPPAQEPSLGFVEWGADGRTLIYKWVDEQGRASFWTIPAQGGAARLLARVADPQRPSPRPEFATDGRRLYFTIAERVSDLWSMELSSSPR